MEGTADVIKLKLDESNELLFGVQITGAKRANSVFRIVCEGRDQMELMFQGHPTADGEVKFILPALAEYLDPGTHSLHLEVVVDNKLFVPMHFDADFDHGTKVVAESVKVVSRKSKAPEASGASAKLIRVGDQQVKESKGSRATKGPKGTKKGSELTLRELYNKKRATKKEK